MKDRNSSFRISELFLLFGRDFERFNHNKTMMFMEKNEFAAGIRSGDGAGAGDTF